MSWNVNVVLIVAAINEGFSPNLSILLLKDGQIPREKLPIGEASLLYVENMLERMTDLKKGWAGSTPVQKGVFEQGNDINIVYYLLLPQEVKTTGKWVKLDNLPLDEYTQSLIRYAVL